MSRLRHSLLAVGFAAGIALATLTTAAIAQDIAASTYTTENVDALHPFGTLPIDRSRLAAHTENVQAFLNSFSAAQLLELQQRCVVITGNAATYQADVVAFCNAVLAAARAAAP